MACMFWLHRAVVLHLMSCMTSSMAYQTKSMYPTIQLLSRLSSCRNDSFLKFTNNISLSPSQVRTFTWRFNHSIIWAVIHQAMRNVSKWITDWKWQSVAHTCRMVSSRALWSPASSSSLPHHLLQRLARIVLLLHWLTHHSPTGETIKQRWHYEVE